MTKRGAARLRPAASFTLLETPRIILDVPHDPFDAEMLLAFAHFSRRFPDLTLAGFRVLWEEAGALMDDAVQLGYEPSEAPGLLRTGPYLVRD